MIGLGVAFAAVPFLSIFLPDLVTQVQPLTLLLNGLTALFAAFGFARAGYVKWREAGICAVVGMLVAPLGSLLAPQIPENTTWILYFLCVAVLLYLLFRPQPVARKRTIHLREMVMATILVTILASLLGIGPGFLLVPALITLGMGAKHAAALNIVVAAPSSFVALLPRLAGADFDPMLTTALLVAGALGALLGAYLSSHYASEKMLKYFFATVVILLSVYKIYTLL